MVHSPSEPLNDSSIAGCPYNAGALDCRETATVRMSCRFASSGAPDQSETLDVAYADASRRNGSPPGCRPPGVSSPPNDGRVCGAAVSGDTGGEGSPPGGLPPVRGRRLSVSRGACGGNDPDWSEVTFNGSDMGGQGGKDKPLKAGNSTGFAPPVSHADAPAAPRADATSGDGNSPTGSSHLPPANGRAQGSVTRAGGGNSPKHDSMVTRSKAKLGTRKAITPVAGGGGQIGKSHAPGSSELPSTSGGTRDSVTYADAVRGKGNPPDCRPSGGRVCGTTASVDADGSSPQGSSHLPASGPRGGCASNRGGRPCHSNARNAGVDADGSSPQGSSHLPSSGAPGPDHSNAPTASVDADGSSPQGSSHLPSSGARGPAASVDADGSSPQGSSHLPFSGPRGPTTCGHRKRESSEASVDVTPRTSTQDTQSQSHSSCAWTGRDEPATNGFACSACGSSYVSKMALTQHRRLSHPGEYHASLSNSGQRAGKKRRWCHEEKVLLAREEIRLSGESGMTQGSINLELGLLFPERTLEAIKCLRRNPAFRALVNDLQNLQSAGTEGADSAVTVENLVGQDALPHDGEGGQPEPTTQAAVTAALAEKTRQNVGKLCLSTEEVEELVGLAEPAIGDPTGPEGQRVQGLIDKEYHQWIQELPIPKPKEAPEAHETRKSKSKSRDRRRNEKYKGESPRRGPALSRKQQRRKAFGVLQALYKKNRSRCAKTVLSGDWAKEKRFTSLEEQESYWKPLFEENSAPGATMGTRVSETLYGLSVPVTSEEYGLVLRTTNDSSPGIDGIDKKVLSSFDGGAVVAHMNLWLLAGRPPEAFKEGVTVPLPKSADAAGPAEHRPITMSSMLCRLFHRLLARRAEKELPLQPRQKAFREGDGLADNVWILRSIIDDCKARHRPLCVTFVDVRKAFDTVSHESIVNGAERIGFPPGLLSYIRCLYTGGATQIRVGRTLGSVIRPRRGVRQGDPLSPLLFCAVMDWVLAQLDGQLGLELAGGVRVNHLAFADDVALLSTTPEAMKRLLCELECGLSKVGLFPNSAKSASLRILATGKSKKWWCDPSQYLSLGGEPVPPIGISGTYKYLGIKTGAGTKVGTEVTYKLDQHLMQLSKAPLKPQQRLFFLRVHVIPGLYHELVLCRYSKSLLVNLDRKVRLSVRRWLHLPHDVPKPMFHAHTAEGGLGLPELAVQVPLMRRARVDALFRRASENRDAVLSAIIAMSKPLRREQQRWAQGVQCYSQNVTSRATKERATAAALHVSRDGVGLTDCNEVPAVSRWVSSGTMFMSGKSFIDAVKVRTGSLIQRQEPLKGAGGSETEKVYLAR